MRGLVFVSIVAASAAPAIAQTSPKPSQSADEIVCKMLPEDCAPPVYSAEQRVAGAKTEQDFSFTPKKAKSTARAATLASMASNSAAAVRETPATRYSATGRVARPALVTRAVTPTRAAAATPGAATAGLDMRVNFLLASAELTGESRVQADEFAKALLNPRMAGRRFRIEGHTDAMGTRADNLLLSQNRADAVVKYLIDKGVSKDRLEPVGYGFDRPLNRAVPLSAKNRRVEIAIIK